MSTQILWADDEIENLRSHILFLEEKGFEVTPVTNGEDAISIIREHRFDLVFLDEQMPGMDGLDTLNRIKRERPVLPVVMITKNEEESIMEDAIGSQISDYLIKPVNPNQILSTIKRILDRSRLRGESTARKYLQSFNQIASGIAGPLDWNDWIDIYTRLTRWDLELEDGDVALRQILSDQFSEANHAFGKFIEAEYRDWLESGQRPVLSPDIVKRYVMPAMETGKPVFFIVIDCMRYDQWLVFEQLLQPLYHIRTDYYYSILPTATPYARNAIFSGLFPIEIEKNHPNLWETSDENEYSLNRFEDQLLTAQLRKHGIRVRPKYEKVLQMEEGRKLASNIVNYVGSPLTAIVFNFVDTLVHSRSDSNILREIAHDVPAFRALTRAWFEHSPLIQLFQILSGIDATVLVTTDHGSIRALRDTKVLGDRDTSTNLRYKYGRNLKVDSATAIFVDKPSDYKLPANNGANNYIFAKDDYYFVYPTNYHHYRNQYRDTFQHGGVSMEEVLLPVGIMTPK